MLYSNSNKLAVLLTTKDLALSHTSPLLRHRSFLFFPNSVYCTPDRFSSDKPNIMSLTCNQKSNKGRRNGRTKALGPMEVPNLVERFFSFKPPQNNHRLERSQPFLSTKAAITTNVPPFTLISACLSHDCSGIVDTVSPLTSSPFQKQDPELSFQVASLSFNCSIVDPGERLRYIQQQHLQGNGDEYPNNHSQLPMTRVKPEIDHIDSFLGQTQQTQHLPLLFRETLPAEIYKLPAINEDRHVQSPLPFQHDPHAFPGRATDFVSQSERSLGGGDIESTETKLRPYPCRYCGKRFKQKPHKKCHELVVHRKLKSYKCYVCLRGFGTRSNLHRHINVKHGGNKDTKCRICKSVFARVSHLESHLGLVHRMQPRS